MLLNIGVRLGGGGLVSFEQDRRSGEAGGRPWWADALWLPDLETLGRSEEADWLEGKRSELDIKP